MRCLYIVHEHRCLCVRLHVFVCGLHMLPITSPICVNHHRRRNRVRHSDYDLKDIREEGEPVTGPARPRCQTNFTHTSFTQFAHALHRVSCASMACIHTLLRRLQIIWMPHTLCSPFAGLLIHTVAWFIAFCHFKKFDLGSSRVRTSVIFFHSLFIRHGRACARTGFFLCWGFFFHCLFNCD